MCGQLTVSGDTSAEKWRSLSWVHLLRDGDDRLNAERGILSVAAVAEDTIDVLLLAHDEVALQAVRTPPAVAAVPASADAVADLVDGLVRGHGDDVADNLVARDTREAGGVCLVRDDRVTVQRRKVSVERDV